MVDGTFGDRWKVMESRMGGGESKEYKKEIEERGDRKRELQQPKKKDPIL